MKKWLAGAAVAVVAASVALDAHAQRRLGGGMNLGKPSPQMQQRQAVPPQKAPQQAAPQQPAQPAAANPASATTAAGAAGRAASPWRGALVGLAAGLGLVALASWLGFGETLAAILMLLLIGMAALLVIGLLLRRMRGPQPAYGAAAGTHGSWREAPLGYDAQPAPRPQTLPRAIAPNTQARPGSAMDEFMRPGASAHAGPWGVPAGFDTEGFLARAKSYFERLQQAWDRDALDELAEFTTHEMFVALTHARRQRPRDGAAAAAQVVSLHAQLLGIDTGADEHLASVRFTGALGLGPETESFDEVWTLVKPVDGRSGWLLAGIQQLDAQGDPALANAH